MQEALLWVSSNEMTQQRPEGGLRVTNDVLCGKRHCSSRVGN